MKYSIKALFLATLIIFNIQSHATILDQSAIDKKALEIETKLTRERYLMYGLTTISVAHELYQWIPMLRDLFSQHASADIKGPDLSFFQSIKAGAKHLFYTKEGWVSLIQSCFSIGGFVVISQMGEHFIHPDTLRWYISMYAPYQVTITLMREQLKDLRNSSIDSEQRQINNKTLQLLFNRLARQAMLMCAYVTYKVKHLNKSEKIIAESAKSLLLSIHYKWLNDIEEQMRSEDQDYGRIESLLDAYEKAITAQINYFALIEGETRKERADIKKSMKQS